MNPMISIWIIVGIMAVLMTLINFVFKMYVKTILKKFNITGNAIGAVFSCINATIITAAIILSIIAVTNYNPSVNTESNISIQAPLPRGFEAPTEKEIRQTNTNLTEVETAREKQKREAEEKQKQLENEAINKGSK